MINNKKIVIAGGSGFIGQELCRYFEKYNSIIVLTRNMPNANNSFRKPVHVAGSNIRFVQWDGKNTSDWVEELNHCDILINLNGRSVNCRYNFRNMKEIFDSRVQATNVLARAINMVDTPPPLWINAASATIYRNAMDRSQNEYSGEISDWKAMNCPPTSLQDLKAFLYKIFGWALPSLFVSGKNDRHKDFSVRVCRKWEAAFDEAITPHTRKVCLRTAITLGEGGVLVPYKNLAKYGLGGKQGNGKQMFSWIHAIDLGRIIEWIYLHPELKGVFNCSSPFPVTNQKFMKTLRRAIGFRYGLPAFKWMLEIGAKIIGTETELLLKSRWVIPTRLLESGFEFRYAKLETAIRETLHRK